MEGESKMTNTTFLIYKFRLLEKETNEHEDLLISGHINLIYTTEIS